MESPRFVPRRQRGQLELRGRLRPDRPSPDGSSCSQGALRALCPRCREPAPRLLHARPVAAGRSPPPQRNAALPLGLQPGRLVRAVPGGVRDARSVGRPPSHRHQQQQQHHRRRCPGRDSHRALSASLPVAPARWDDEPPSGMGHAILLLERKRRVGRRCVHGQRGASARRAAVGQARVGGGWGAAGAWRAPSAVRPARQAHVPRIQWVHRTA
mmetsp:Transcript_16554/g.52787  ORF Transcript_16554/g.52787 Transcript_16554/m.52787 type:complete len:213 (+) Transcript_16554:2314-2952(+)